MTMVIYTPNEHLHQLINHDIVRRWRKWSASCPGRFISATEHNGGDEKSHAGAVIKRVLNLKLRVFSDVTLCRCVSSRTAEEPRLLHCLTPKMKTLWCFETSENMYPTTHRGIPEDLNFTVIISPTEWCYLIYLLTPWSRVLLEQLTGSAASQEITRIFGTRRFITVLTSARHLSLSWANSIQSSQPPPTSWRSILILSSHLRLGLPSGLFPTGFPTRTLCTPLPSPIRADATLY